jgi:hypothetical protein
MGIQLDLFADDLPEWLRVLALHEPYASLVVDGIKTIETREWPWPYPPGWLVVHAAKKYNKAVALRLGLPPKPSAPGGRLIGLVWVTGSRPLVPEDEKAACFYEPDRFAWPLERHRRFVKPIPFPGPQKFASIERGRVLEALGR